MRGKANHQPAPVKAGVFKETAAEKKTEPVAGTCVKLCKKVGSTLPPGNVPTAAAAERCSCRALQLQEDVRSFQSFQYSTIQNVTMTMLPLMT